MGRKVSAAESGGVARDDARQRLVLEHERLALAVARRYRRLGLEPEDLAQEARLGLLRASARFDPARGVRFATYAPWWVRRTLQDALRCQGACAGGLRAAGCGERRRGAVTPPSPPAPALPDDAERVRAGLRLLPPAQAAVLRLRHGLEGCAPRTPRAVARAFALTPEAVGRIERQAVRRLKIVLEDRERRGVD